ncbi:MAG: hypothetical protein SOX84_06865 [Prevotella sp.]|nr:hypothetical protein [Prevotella sp.]MDY4218488.1 hypothetical protein [Prevotella sp.]
METTLPTEFQTYTKTLMGDTLYARFLDSLNEEPPVSLRINPFKRTAEYKVNERYAAEPVSWCRHAYYLSKRPNFTFDPLFHAGVYYVQEAASMFLDHVVRHFTDNRPVLALDLCAAPGGKTTCLAAALPPKSFLFANEPMKKRVQILAENRQKFGAPNLLVTNNYPADYRKTNLRFDLIVADVPCSGEGMFRKDPQTIGEWSTQNVMQCQQLQRTIIADIWHNLKEGGLLVYSTCTFNAHENEENIAWILNNFSAELLSVPIEDAWNIMGSLIGNPVEDKQTAFPVYRFIPGTSKSEGLFMAVVRKGKQGDTSLPSTTSETIKKAVSEAHKQLKVISSGVSTPTIKGKTILPDHSLALAVSDQKLPYPTIDIDYETAIAYLRREAIHLAEDAPKGIVLLTYRNHSIGFAKNLGNRANNLYPQEWRIKSTHVPAEDCIITW